jgi:hypothetical protein
MLFIHSIYLHVRGSVYKKVPNEILS